ncbi:MAG TPA: maleylacetoacetate isomerase [Kofleriaceae bacterium]|nr:maleylacetoacetate isomerase [Kofleriaceae bacterium]
MRLYNWHGSSASFRARIALRLKGIEFEYVPVKLRKREQDGVEYRRLNPQGRVPLLVDGEVSIAQTIAIVEYLEEVRPEPPLLPADHAGRARVRSLSLFVACEVQPLNNSRVERHLVKEIGLGDEQMVAWRRKWITEGFDAVETMLSAPETGRYCHGDRPGMADCFLVPQVFKALGPGVALDLARWPTIERVYGACLELEAFAGALPGNQPDAEEVTLP